MDTLKMIEMGVGVECSTGEVLVLAQKRWVGSGTLARDPPNSDSTESLMTNSHKVSRCDSKSLDLQWSYSIETVNGTQISYTWIRQDPEVTLYHEKPGNIDYKVI